MPDNPVEPSLDWVACVVHIRFPRARDRADLFGMVIGEQFN